jgi:DNA-binding NarL/FixJ family response regulator
MKKMESFVVAPLSQISVLLAEDHAGFRKSLKLLVELEEDIDVVGEAKNGHEAVDMNKRLKPRVIIMDLTMPFLNGLQATRQIIKTSPRTRVLMLSANPDPGYIEEAMLSGASGYLIKQSSTQFVARGIREVLKGNTFFSTSISKQLRDQCRAMFGKGETLKRKAAGSALA